MTMVQEKVSVPPVRVSQIMHGTWALQALRSAVELNFFAQLERGPLDSPSIAAVCDTDRRATEMLLDAVAGLGLIVKEGNTYALTDEAKVYLAPSSALYMGNYLQQNDAIDSMWRGLSDTVKTGRPAKTVNTDEQAQQFFPRLAEAIFPLSFAVAQQVSEQLKVAQLEPGARVLDVAAGAGTWSIPMALDNASLHVDALDFPSILEVTKKFVAQYGLTERYGYISGNWRNVSWQKDSYNLVLLGHILHSEGSELSVKLLKRCFETMKSGGTLVIGEFITNNERNGPAMAMLFGVNMLMHTEIGCVFSEQELHSLLQAAGFENVTRLSLFGVAESMVITAKKP